MQERPLVRQYVGRAIIQQHGKTLLVNKIGEPHWFLPGGRVEPHEGVREAVVREIKEELNENATLGKFIGCIEHGFATETKDYYEVGFFFLAQLQNTSRDNSSNEEELRFRWATLSEMATIDIRPPPVKKLLSELNAGKQFLGSWNSTVETQ